MHQILQSRKIMNPSRTFKLLLCQNVQNRKPQLVTLQRKLTYNFFLYCSGCSN